MRTDRRSALRAEHFVYLPTDLIEAGACGLLHADLTIADYRSSVENKEGREPQVATPRTEPRVAERLFEGTSRVRDS